MKTSRAEEIRLRQQLLLLRSQELRGQLSLQAAALQPPLAWADQLRAGWAWLRGHPEWPIGAALVVIVIRPRRALRWGTRLWWAWQTLRRLRDGLQRLDTKLNSARR